MHNKYLQVKEINSCFKFDACGLDLLSMSLFFQELAEMLQPINSKADIWMVE